MTATYDRRVDALVVVFTGLVVAALVAMATGVAELLAAAVPLLLTVLMLLGSLGSSGGWSRRVLAAVVAFNALSTVFWVAVAAGASSQALVFGGLSLAMGVLVYVAWPVYTFLAGPLYAYVLDHLDDGERS